MVTYSFPRPALTVDIMVILDTQPREVLLVKRALDPFSGRWALPGGMVDEGESLEAAARRELKEETGLDVDKIFQVAAFGEPGRDPRGWTISVAHVCLVGPDVRGAVRPDTDASDARWQPIDDIPSMDLAFDHEDVIYEALDKAKALGYI